MRANLVAGGVSAADAESGLEFTWPDRTAGRATLQPDLQVISDADTVILAGVRLTIDLLP